LWEAANDANIASQRKQAEIGLAKLRVVEAAEAWFDGQPCTLLAEAVSDLRRKREAPHA
jgi:hypothetical protein